MRGTHPWREDCSVIYSYSCFWSLPKQSLSGPSSAELMTLFYCLVWDSPNLGGQAPVFIFPRNGVAQLYPWALGSLFIATYDSQGYSEGVLTRLHTELLLISGQSQKVSLRLTVCLGVNLTLELMTRYFLSESCCVVSVVYSLWQVVGSVFCQSLSAVFSPLSKFYFIYILHVTLYIYIYIQYIQGLCLPSHSTADHAPSFVAYATTAV
jgi:hypothetical protein